MRWESWSGEMGVDEGVEGGDLRNGETDAFRREIEVNFRPRQLASETDREDVP